MPLHRQLPTTPSTQGNNTGRKVSASGFTLVELLTTLSILGILLSLAAPALGRQLSSWQRNQATRAFMEHTLLARSEAIKSSRKVVMCISTDHRQCAASSQKDWTHGWLVFRDDNANGQIDAGEPLLADAQKISGVLSVRSNASNPKLTFLPSGILSTGMGSILVRPHQGDLHRIILSRVGRARLSILKAD